MYFNLKWFSVFCFFVFLAVFTLGFTWTKFAWAFAFLMIGGVAIELYLTHQRSKKVVAILHDQGDPQLFLEEMEKDEKIAKEKKMYDVHLLNKSAGLFYLGRWQEAFDALESVNIKKLPPLFKYLYFNNKLANLLGAEQVDAAKALIEDNKSLLDNFPTSNQMLLIIWKNNNAWLDYYKGDYAKSRAVFEETLPINKIQLSKGMTYYFLGLIDLKESKVKDARDHFTKALELSDKTFIKSKINTIYMRYFKGE